MINFFVCICFCNDFYDKFSFLLLWLPSMKKLSPPEPEIDVSQCIQTTMAKSWASPSTSLTLRPKLPLVTQVHSPTTKEGEGEPGNEVARAYDSDGTSDPDSVPSQDRF